MGFLTTIYLIFLRPILIIKEYIMNKTKSSNQISVVYGGSVNLENYKEIYSSTQVDGLLIGGASLDANTFTEIYNMSQ